MLVTFGLCRILLIVPIWYKCYSLIDTQAWIDIDFIYKLVFISTNLPLDILNVYWFTKIAQGFIKYCNIDDKKEN